MIRHAIVITALVAAAPAWAGPITSEASRPPLCKPGEVMVEAAKGKPRCELVPRLIVPPVPKQGDLFRVNNGILMLEKPEPGKCLVWAKTGWKNGQCGARR
jgi:hypothetical protein